MTLFRVDWSKDLFFSFLWTNGPVRTYPVPDGLRSSSIGFDRVSTRAVRVLGRARFKIRFDEFRGLRRCRVFVVIPLIDNVVLRITKKLSFPLLLVTHIVSLTEEYSTKWGVRYNWSVRRAISLRVTMYIFWLVLGARYFPSHRATVCYCH